MFNLLYIFMYLLAKPMQHLDSSSAKCFMNDVSEMTLIYIMEKSKLVICV